MSTPNELRELISAISPENIKKFCRLKFSLYDFERCQTGSGGFFGIDYSVEKNDRTKAHALRQFIDATKDGCVQVMGRFMKDDKAIPILIYAVPLKGSITNRSSKKKQADFAKYILDVAETDIISYNRAWSTRYRIGLFFFYDEVGNFRMSLIEILEKGFRRFTYYVEQDDSGIKNRTFRYRMTNANNEKAARCEIEKWDSYYDIKKAFSVEALTKEFYNELFQWYERVRASSEVIFPYDASQAKPDETDEQFKTRIKSEQVIRLITRLLFVWFIKQKKLVPDELFDIKYLKSILKSFETDEGDNYYRAILQNLFFATLNSEISDRAFAADGSLDENREHFDIKTLYRYRHEFTISEEEILALFRSIPFLNGGLFECLDRGRNYFDGFSRNKAKIAYVPNAFFFAEDEKALGLIPLLKRYNFTIDENAPGDEDIALDPELLGKVFENLLGAVIPETTTTARNASGSFYTPREIVSYMVDESLIAHLLTKLEEDSGENAEAQREQNEKILRQLFEQGFRPDNEELCERLDKALVTAKILDPACGSGAFPMGMLLRMVELLRILRKISDQDSLYELKLELIENCIYGIDIQCIAVQITKLRFFISLVCEQERTGNTTKNYDIDPLPNLETKFVAADSLIGLPEMEQDALAISTGNISQLKEELWDIRHRHFRARTYRKKKELRQQDQDKRDKIKATIKTAIAPNLERLTDLEKQRAEVTEANWQVRENGKDKNSFLFPDMAMEVRETQSFKYDANAQLRKILDAEIAREKKKQNIPSTLIDEIANKLADWNPYDQNTSSPFFDPEWMFNVKTGFDVVIGNPPYFVLNKKNPRKAQYEHDFKHLKSGRINIYQLFFGIAEKMISPNGVVTYIHPKTLLSDAYLLATRRFLTKAFKTFVIVNLVDRKNTFESVLQSVVVSTWIKCKANKNIRVFEINEKKNLDSISFLSLPKTSVITRDETLLVSNDVKIYDIVKKIQSVDVRGLNFRTGSIEWNKYADSLCTIRQPSGARLIYAENIQRYVFVESRLRASITFLEDGKYPILSHPAIFTQRTTAVEQPFRIIATIIDPADFDMPLVTENNTNVYYCSDKKVTLYTLGILNSRFMDFYFRLFNSNTHVSSGELNRLSIPSDLNPHNLQIVDLVDRILAAKKFDPSADTSALEAEIDQIVYQLYGLTAEEIAIVEAATEKAQKPKKVQGKTTPAEPGPAVPPKKPAAKSRNRKRVQDGGIDL